MVNKLDVREDRKIVRWCMTQASRHNSQGVVRDKVNEADESTAVPGRRAVPPVTWTRARGAIRNVVDHQPSQKAVTRVRRVMPAFFEVTRGVSDT